MHAYQCNWTVFLPSFDLLRIESRGILSLVATLIIKEWIYFDQNF
jgi:hypothetical protein